MKNLFLILASLFFTAAYAHQTEIYAGTHFNYMRMRFNNPSHMQGYAGGVTAGIQYRHSYFKGVLDFEGTWNAGPITGDPAQKSSIYEYFLDLNLGPTFLWGKWQFEPYTGFGWDRFNNEQDPGLSELCFLYDKLFVPIGFHANWVLTHFKLGFQFEFRPDVYQNLRLLSINLDPKWGYAFRTKVSVQQWFPFNWGRVCVCFVPFFDWSYFGRIHEENSVGATLDIPRLLYWKTGLRLLIGFEF